tara:strand:- start:4721 stop:4873 length:153 start_codon:yes stop_codon:yes gene_type:complete
MKDRENILERRYLRHRNGKFPHDKYIARNALSLLNIIRKKKGQLNEKENS